MDALNYASDELRNNREIVLASVQQDGLALQYASNELKQDLELLKIAQQKGYRIFLFETGSYLSFL